MSTENEKFAASVDVAKSILTNIINKLDELLENRDPKCKEHRNLLLAIDDDLITFEDVYAYIGREHKASKKDLYWINEDNC